MSDVYILCTRHTRSDEQIFAWWCVDGKGYTYDLDRAWVLPEEEARKRLGTSLDRIVAVDRVNAVAERVCRIGMDGLEAETRAVAALFVDRDHFPKEDLDKISTALAEDREDNVENEGEPECPWCGAKDQEWCHGPCKHVGVDSEWLDHCGHCDKPYAVRTIESGFTFRTARVVEKEADDATEE